jgi:hypothetical protein
MPPKKKELPKKKVKKYKYYGYCERLTDSSDSDKESKRVRRNQLLRSIARPRIPAVAPAPVIPVVIELESEEEAKQATKKS